MERLCGHTRFLCTYQTTNGLGQTTTTQHQPSDGQVTLTTDPNGVRVHPMYDVFGRPIEVDYQILSGGVPINYASSTMMAVNACTADGSGCEGGGIAEDGNEANAVYRLTTSRAGYPTHVDWYDMLGRVIKHAERGFDGTPIETTHIYDPYGTLSMQSMPFFSGAATTYLTAWAYDRLNRPVQKLGEGAEMDSHGNTQTDYTYTGRTTKLTVHPTGIAAPGGVCPTHLSPANLCMSMSRSKNVLGQWMQTTDAMAGVTNTWTEPLTILLYASHVLG